MKIANIIYEKPLVNHTQENYINYYNEPIEFDKLDNSLPTLYVGWSFMKLANPDNKVIQNADILHKKIIANKLYWECCFKESKSSHIKGVANFIKFAPQFYFSPRYTYINLDPVFFQIKNIDDLMDVIPKKIDYLYNYKDELIYLLVNNKITGIDLEMYKYFKFSKEEIIKKLTEKTHIIHTDVQGDLYQSFYKVFPNFSKLKRYIIVLLSN